MIDSSNKHTPPNRKPYCRIFHPSSSPPVSYLLRIFNRRPTQDVETGDQPFFTLGVVARHLYRSSGPQHLLVFCAAALCGGFRQPETRAGRPDQEDLRIEGLDFSRKSTCQNSTVLTIRIKCQSAHMRSKDEVRYSKVVYGIALVPSLSR